MAGSSSVRIGAFTVGLDVAERWIRRYFDETHNRAIAATGGTRRPYAYPVYDRLWTGSADSELTDADFLAPLLLNARPDIRAVYNLQAVRSRLEEGLAAISVAPTLTEAAANNTLASLLTNLFGVLDGPAPTVGIGLTTLSKILHRKRPHMIPLYDRRVKRCCVGPSSSHPVKPVSPSAPDGPFYTAVATCMAHDLADQRDANGERAPSG